VLETGRAPVLILRNNTSRLVACTVCCRSVRLEQGQISANQSEPKSHGQLLQWYVGDKPDALAAGETAELRFPTINGVPALTLADVAETKYQVCRSIWVLYFGYSSA
jgi:hypothetical protein